MNSLTPRAKETYPDDELDIGAGGAAAEELEGASDVHGADLVCMLSLSFVLGAEEVEDAVEALLFNFLDLDSLEDLSGTFLQFLHLLLLLLGSFTFFKL